MKQTSDGVYQSPEIIAETAAYLVVYKPPFMHSAPLGEDRRGTLLDYAARLYPEILKPRGRKICEGGLLHRLDYETRGLLLIARNQAALDNFSRQQESGLFVKEYEAVSEGKGVDLPGFPQPACCAGPPGAVVRSAFRPYGKGRRAVRPLPAGGIIYITEILSITDTAEGKRIFQIRLMKGFRHQIRCHLAWIGWPVRNDALYGGVMDGSFLALNARFVAFNDPETGERREYRLGNDRQYDVCKSPQHIVS
jgi:23S rRNA pseudouridine1911/1915/1917 synthase